MEDDPVNVIRESTRNLLQLNRRLHRNEDTDLRRSIPETRITRETMIDIAGKLKNKSAITFNDLQTLKNGLAEDKDYIKLVFNTQGVVRGLVRELTGHDVKKQCAAAGCLCNLALGGSKIGVILANAAGAYLTAALDNLTMELAVTCAWTIGNLAGAGPMICDVLISQGALKKLIEVHPDENLQDAALYALVQFTYQKRDDLRSDYVIKMLETISKLEITFESTRLLFIISCHFSPLITDELLQKILEDLLPSIEHHMESCSQMKICCKLVYLLRTLANMDQKYGVILNYFTVNNFNEPFKKLLNTNKDMRDTCYWLLGNLFNFCDEKQFFYMLC